MVTNFPCRVRNDLVSDYSFSDEQSHMLDDFIRYGWIDLMKNGWVDSMRNGWVDSMR